MMGDNNNIMSKGETTSLSKAGGKTSSLKATVPRGIVGQLDLRGGDKARWLLVPDGKKLRVMVEFEKKDGGANG